MPLQAKVRRELERAMARARFDKAAEIWQKVLDQALESGDLELAREASVQVGDCLRRDDRPAATLKAITRSLELLDHPGLRALQEVQLASALSDAGFLDGAEQSARQVLARVDRGPLRAIAADTLAGILLARGDLFALRGVVEQLLQEAEGAVAISARFRKAQLQRLDGQLDEALDTLLLLARELQDQEGMAAGAGAALCELGELCMLRGQWSDAYSFFSSSVASWTTAGRRAGLFQAEAGRARAQVAQGVAPLPSLRDRAIDYAHDRAMPLLEASLRLARGAVRSAGGSDAASGDFQAAILLADTAGAPWLAGRARLELHALWPQSSEELQRAVDQLSGNTPLRNLACVALAESLADTDPRRSLELAAAAVCRLSVMGLQDGEERARRLLARLPR